MNAREVELLDDIEAWRHATTAHLDGTASVGMRGAFARDSAPVLRVASGKYSRVEAEPEMVEALAKVREALSLLEFARVAIVERKLHELRVLGIREPGVES